MESEKPGSVQQGSSEDDQHSFDEFEQSLISMENIDRTSPELWPEKFPGLTDFISSYANLNTTKLPYNKKFNHEDQTYMNQLSTLSTSSLVSKVKELHDITYQLGLEESKEMTRGKYLNIFNRKIRKEK
ncbi:PREDICTED: protein lin-52 homolog [Nicrophorus vespilloides]|uniref:Protein lin-52 homolog n=1 Tax=Nicrophorus vespilloides TaxID=110193 RepID=A0ABM1N8J3_NICVS|nr:PREDICTED: protein lin-52 homolog [Nicrophorus vespilloides]